MRLVFASLAVAAVVFGPVVMAKEEGSKIAAATDQKPFKMVFTNKLIDGKKTWLPATVNVPDGRPVEFQLVNQLDAPHGFEVMGLSDAVVVLANETKTLKFAAKGKGEYKIRCHMHPTHVGGMMTVQ